MPFRFLFVPDAIGRITGAEDRSGGVFWGLCTRFVPDHEMKCREVLIFLAFFGLCLVIDEAAPRTVSVRAIMLYAGTEQRVC